MFKVVNAYVDGDTATFNVACEIDSLLKYDLVIQIDKTQKRYTVIENPYPENEIIIRKLGMETGDVELKLHEIIRDGLDSILSVENLTHESNFADYIYSIKQWLDDGDSLY